MCLSFAGVYYWHFLKIFLLTVGFSREIDCFISSEGFGGRFLIAAVVRCFRLKRLIELSGERHFTLFGARTSYLPFRVNVF